MKIQDYKLEVSYISIVILRVMLSLIFIIASISHFLNTKQTVQRIESAHFSFIGKLFGPPEFTVIFSGVVMLMAGICLLIGFKTRWSALVLIAVLLPITLTVQLGSTATLGPLFKNVAIFGGILFFSLNSNLKIRKQ